MIIFYSAHARENIRKRKIELIWIKEILKFPDLLIRKGRFKFHAIKKLNGKTLKIVFIKKRYIKVIILFCI